MFVSAAAGGVTVRSGVEPQADLGRYRGVGPTVAGRGRSVTCGFVGAPDGIRTRAAGLKGQYPRPLDDGSMPHKRGGFSLAACPLLLPSGDQEPMRSASFRRSFHLAAVCNPRSEERRVGETRETEWRGQQTTEYYCTQ